MAGNKCRGDIVKLGVRLQHACSAASHGALNYNDASIATDIWQYSNEAMRRLTHGRTH